MTERIKAAEMIFERKLAAHGEKGITEQELIDYVRSFEDPELADGIFDYETMKDFLHYEIFKWCGCGMPEEADKAVLTYLESLKYFSLSNNTTEPTKTITIEPGTFEGILWLCLMYTVEVAGLTDHGSSIYGSWLTTKGMAFRIILRRWQDEYDAIENSRSKQTT